MALLDEAMAHAAGFAGHRGVTATVNVRFRKPVPLEQPIEVRGRVTWQRRNVLGVEASILDARQRARARRGEFRFARQA